MAFFGDKLFENGDVKPLFNTESAYFKDKHPFSDQLNTTILFNLRDASGEI